MLVSTCFLFWFYSARASLYLRLTLFIIINGVKLRECLRTGHAWRRIGLLVSSMLLILVNFSKTVDHSNIEF